MKVWSSIAFLGLWAVAVPFCLAQTKPGSPPPLPLSKVQPVLDTAAEEGKFTFVVFTKGDSAAVRSMVQTVKDGVEARSKQATYIVADANAAGEQAIIEQFGVGRAPMPLTLAVAPNGAVTGIFPKAVQDEQLTASIVPPTMMRCMKLLQDQKLVFVCLTQEPSKKAATPAGVLSLQLDPNFKDRIEVISMTVTDTKEARFLEQMKIDPAQVKGPYAVLIAPPGVLIGHYGAQATPMEIAAAIHKAGKCCDDPNCKHNQAAPSTPSTTKTAVRRK